ncbi:MAG TPA: DUF4105 domain-containing protein [Pirellulales bacterium]|nr:DUF4105 domain-containing protein [Pirellulales bacterium]
MNIHAGSLCVGSLMVASLGWMALVVHYHWRRRWVRWLISILPVAVDVGSLAVLPRGRGFAVWGSTLAAVWLWWFTRRPRTDRAWACDMAVLPRITIDGDTARIEGFRDFRYDASGAPLPQYAEKTFDLVKQRSVDLFLSHWTGPIMAHTLVSFGFDDGQYLAVSVEARRQSWQRYSPLWGLFRCYELMYVIGDERDIVRVRTNVRRERVYMYRVKLPLERIRTLLCDYLERAQSLAERPDWYNSIVSNCTTNLFCHRHRQLRWWLRPGIFLNGLSARTLYRAGGLIGDGPFRELHARAAIADLALAAGDSADFSQQIRARLVETRPTTTSLVL